VKVRKSVRQTLAAIGRVSLVLPISMALLLAVQTAPASALTRAEVIKRANVWVQKRVPYSQHGYYRGYRRDCSGMVSMAWALKTSYTSRSIVSKAFRIPKNQLKPGDAVRTPGHVAIFAGWKGKSRQQYWVLQQSGRGTPANRRLKTWRSNAQALRRRGILNRPPRLVAAKKPATGPVVVASAAITITPLVPATHVDAVTAVAASVSTAPALTATSHQFSL